MRSYMRDINMGRDPDASIPAAVGMSEEEMYDMYRLLAIAKYDERYVIPRAHAELADRLAEHGSGSACGLDFAGGPGNCGAVPAPDAGSFMLADRPSSVSVPLRVVRRGPKPDAEGNG